MSGPTIPAESQYPDNEKSRELPNRALVFIVEHHRPANAAGDFSLCLHSHAAEFHPRSALPVGLCGFPFQGSDHQRGFRGE